jgi:HD-GYP domain-containing protein (c-di-GMP phosphodiesterase class II)
LAGEQIPLEARILAVAESYEAMTHDRPQRAALNSAQAVRELVRCADAGYDRQCVIALAEAVNMTQFLPTEWSSPPEQTPEPAAELDEPVQQPVIA